MKGKGEGGGGGGAERTVALDELEAVPHPHGAAGDAAGSDAAHEGVLVDHGDQHGRRGVKGPPRGRYRLHDQVQQRRQAGILRGRPPFRQLWRRPSLRAAESIAEPLTFSGVPRVLSTSRPNQRGGCGG